MQIQTVTDSVSNANLVAPQTTPRKLLFSVDDFHKMTEAGILPEQSGTEIINGELLIKNSQNGDNVYRFDVDDVYKIMELGLFPRGKRFEIINGEIIEKMSIGRKHASKVNRLNRILGSHFGETAIMSIQNPVVLSKKNEPEPDVAVLKPREDFYAENHPQPKDVLLLIEVSDSTLDYDKKTKIPPYAKSQIAEVWIIDLQRSQIEVHSNPENSIYQQVATFKRGDELKSATIENLTVSVDEILGAEIAEVIENTESEN